MSNQLPIGPQAFLAAQVADLADLLTQGQFPGALAPRVHASLSFLQQMQAQMLVQSEMETPPNPNPTKESGASTVVENKKRHTVPRAKRRG